MLIIDTDRKTPIEIIKRINCLEPQGSIDPPPAEYRSIKPIEKIIIDKINNI
jgi:hypothetical protein|tara:strand:+ start:28 stop:183 length:156 start_codon:yes stop_codon:yes gene_type:complete